MAQEHTQETRWQAAEVKFVVPPECARQIKAWARQHLQPDPHCSPELGDGYRISSLYFDNAHFDLYHQRGSFARAKYRIRRYGATESAWLERKLKNDIMIAKRRSATALDELERMDPSQNPDKNWPGFWFHRRLRARRFDPVCQIAYQRMARVLPSDNGIVRLTIDDDIRALPVDTIRFTQSGQGKLLLEHSFIVEMKYQQNLPVLFERLINEFQLVAQPVSKYRLAVEALEITSPRAYA